MFGQPVFRTIGQSYPAGFYDIGRTADFCPFLNPIAGTDKNADLGLGADTITLLIGCQCNKGTIPIGVEAP